MKVFVTGASGFIGTAVTAELLEAGHEVLGLARSDASAALVEAGGASVWRGDLADLDSIREGALAADGVVHLAYDHGFTDFVAAAALDQGAVLAIADALVDTGRPFVMTSGTLALASLGHLGTERDVPEIGHPRLANEQLGLAYADRGVRASVIRLAPTVHGEGDHGFVPRLIAIAREKGVSAMVGDGTNRWPAVHRRDAARLYRLAVESAPAGTRLHGAAEEGIPFRQIAETIAQHLNVPVGSVTPEEAGEHFGFLGGLVSLDNPTSSAVTRELVGWNPTNATLLDDLNEGHYFVS